MLFHSWQFAVFFAVIFFSYYLLPHKYRWMLLLAGSYYFYMCWNARLVLLIAGVTGVTFLAALLLSRAKSASARKAYAACGIICPLLALFFFKYFDFFSLEVTGLLRRLAVDAPDRTMNLILPIGISFYTFQALSYVIDVYRGNMDGRQHLGKYALYISFFPQLVAGPIERSANLLPQFEVEQRFSQQNATEGLQRMALGYFKKLVVADLLAIKVDPVFAHVTGYRGFSLALATVLFAIQIYCDFSGYSDIAIGAAKMLGFDLMKNFNSPYLSRSIREFWKRWHISLSSWFSDYVYIPLGGSRVPLARHCFNLLVTFLISGLWHGANWTFIAWGGVHGLYTVCGVLLRRIRPPEGLRRIADAWPVKTLQRLFVFFLACVAWVFFRAENLPDAFHVFRYCLEGAGDPLRYVQKGVELMNFRFDGIVKPLIGAAILLGIDGIQLKRDPIDWLNGRPPALRILLSVVFVLLIVMFSEKGIASQFIYFQF